MSNPTPRPGQFAKWRQTWHRVAWCGPVRDGRMMAKLVPYPREGAARPFFVPVARIEELTDRDPLQADREFDRLLSRDH